METNDKALQDPTVTHRLFKAITDMSDDERRTLLRLLETGLLKGKCRRSYFRKQKRLPVAYANKRDIYRNLTRDISLGGVFILTTLPFQIGEELRILFKSEGEGNLIRFLGKVVRITPEGIGVKFLSTNPEKKSFILSIASEPD